MYTEGLLECNFCGKTDAEVTELICGPGPVYICNECVELCVEIIRDNVRRNMLVEAHDTAFRECYGTD